MNIISPGIFPPLSAEELRSKSINHSSGEFLCAKSLERATSENSIYVLRSFHVDKHNEKQEGEIDFLIITDECIICVEVKSSRLRQVPKGFQQWDRGKNKWLDLKESPFQQSKSNCYSLRGLSDSLGANRIKLPIVWCVWFPEMEGFDVGVEYSSWKIALKGDLNDPMRFLNEFIHNTRLNLKKSRFKMKPVPSQMLYRYINVLRRFDHHDKEDPQLEYLSSVRHLRNNIKLLTEVQQDAFRLIQDNLEIVVRGGAGTGKTYLAMIEALRLSEMNKRVLILAYSLQVCNMIQDWIIPYNKGERNISVLQISDESISHELEFCDAVIIDEYQDILNEDKFKEICVNRNGNYVRLFGDHINQVMDEELDREWENFDSLTERYTSVLLSQNCRNTSQIVSAVKTFIEVKEEEEYRESRISGEKIRLAVVSSIDAIRSELENLLAKGIEEEDVVVISLENTFLFSFSELTSAIQCDFRNVKCALPAEVKGLEFAHVFVVGVGGKQYTVLKLRELYVAITRAMISCTLMYDVTGDSYEALKVVKKIKEA